MVFSLRLRHASHVLIRAHGAVAVAPEPVSPDLNRNLDRAVKILHIASGLLPCVGRQSQQAGEVHRLLGGEVEQPRRMVGTFCG